MDPRLLEYYERELQFIRETGGEFAREFPKIAGRLGMDSLTGTDPSECADPYVERLIEGFAFLAARVQLKVDAEFPRFTQHLLEMVYPHYLCPVPSMAVVQILPRADGSLQGAVRVVRGSKLRANLAHGEQTACEYRTAHDVTLWPIEIVEAEYLSSTGAVAALGVPKGLGYEAGLRLRLRSTAGTELGKLGLDSLALFIKGAETAVHLYEQLTANLRGVMVQPTSRPFAWNARLLPASAVKRPGFADEEAMLPHTSQSFSGYRLLQEYFAFPERFQFIEITQLHEATRLCKDDSLDLVFLFSRGNADLVEAVDASVFNLFCTPAINLFPKRADRIPLSNRTEEYHIVPDRTRTMDYEVYGVSSALGYGDSTEPELELLPFYQVTDRRGLEKSGAFYTLYREQRRISTGRRRSRSSYIGQEVFISLVDSREAPYPAGLKQLGIETLCTNRHLPLSMPVGIGASDFTLESGAPYDSIRCLAGPTPPRASNAVKETAWQLISHLSLNYLSLTDNDREHGAKALRQMLSLYGDVSDPSISRQIAGVLSIDCRPVVRRLNLDKTTSAPVPITFGRGLEITISLDELAFKGSGPFVLGAVLEEFFARYVSINSFTETVVSTTQRGEIMRWPARTGKRQII